MQPKRSSAFHLVVEWLHCYYLDVGPKDQDMSYAKEIEWSSMKRYWKLKALVVVHNCTKSTESLEIIWMKDSESIEV